MRTEKLPVTLTPAEIQQKGEEIAARVTERETVELERKDKNEGYKLRIKELDKTISGLVDQVKNHREYRDVEITTEHDHEKNVVRTIRTDTGEVVRARAMTPEEKQADLFPGIHAGKGKGTEAKSDAGAQAKGNGKGSKNGDGKPKQQGKRSGQKKNQGGTKQTSDAG